MTISSYLIFRFTYALCITKFTFPESGSSGFVFNPEPNADKHSTTFDKVISVSLSLGCKRLLDLNVRFEVFDHF